MGLRFRTEGYICQQVQTISILQQIVKVPSARQDPLWIGISWSLCHSSLIDSRCHLHASSCSYLAEYLHQSDPGSGRREASLHLRRGPSHFLIATLVTSEECSFQQSDQFRCPLLWPALLLRGKRMQARHSCPLAHVSFGATQEQSHSIPIFAVLQTTLQKPLSLQ